MCEADFSPLMSNPSRALRECALMGTSAGGAVSNLRPTQNAVIHSDHGVSKANFGVGLVAAAGE
jgi:hypothetical protein